MIAQAQGKETSLTHGGVRAVRYRGDYLSVRYGLSHTQPLLASGQPNFFRASSGDINQKSRESQHRSTLVMDLASALASLGLAAGDQPCVLPSRVCPMAVIFIQYAVIR